MTACYKTKDTLCSETVPFTTKARYFESKCSLGQELDDLSAPFPYVRPRTDQALSDVRFRVVAVERTLRQLNPSKATGPDRIPARVLKTCSAELAQPLSILFTQCFQTAIQPKTWKIANIVPIFKRKSKSLPSNYRPVSLLCILSKVMETIINRTITNFLESNNVFSTRQFGFRHGHSAADLLTSLHHQWLHTAGEKGAARILAIDIAGAFDRVSHPGVLHKSDVYGLRGQLHQWLSSYLSERYLQVVICGQTSSRLPIQAGIPQGSILGPTLFLMYVNNCEDHVPAGADLASFADDTTLYANITPTTQEDTTQALQLAVNNISRWGQEWKIEFEPAKSQALTVSFHRTQWDMPPIDFNGSNVTEQEELKILGISFDGQLTFRRHLRTVALRATQRLGALRKAFHLLDVPGLIQAYNAFVRPVMEYCPIVWMGAAPSHLARLDRVQARAIHAIAPMCWLPSLALRRMVAALCLLYKMHCPDAHPLLQRMLPPQQPQHRTVHSIRSTFQRCNAHAHQLANELPVRSRNNLCRAYPHAVVPVWNQLPAGVFSGPFCTKNLQHFKAAANRYLKTNDWSWAHDHL